MTLHLNTASIAGLQKSWRRPFVLVLDNPCNRIEKLKLLDRIEDIVNTRFSSEGQPHSPVAVRVSTARKQASYISPSSETVESVHWFPGSAEQYDITSIIDVRTLNETNRNISIFLPKMKFGDPHPPGERNRRLRILLMYLKDPRDSRWRNMSIPLAPLVLAESAERRGHSVEIAGVENPGQWLIGIDKKFDIIGISLFEDYFEKTAAVIRFIKQHFKGWVIAGGPMATLAPRAVAAHLPEIDMFLSGEAEDRFPETLEMLAGLRRSAKETVWTDLIRLSSIKGLFWEAPRRMVVGVFPPIIPEYPASSSIAVRHLSKNDFLKGLDIATSRGCPRACRFCSHLHGRIVKKRSLTAIEAELDRLKGRLKTLNWVPEKDGIPALNINDDDILLHPQRCLDILNLIKQKGFRVWGVQTSVGSLKRAIEEHHILSVFKKSGVFAWENPVLWIGTDAFVDERLRRLGKSGRQNDIRYVCDSIYKNGCSGYHYWILTDADSDWNEFLEELYFIKKLNNLYGDSFRILPNAATLIPYPSTDMFLRRVKEGKIHQIVLRSILSLEEAPEFDYPLVRHERPLSNYLYALVEPRSVTSERFRLNAWAFLRLLRESGFEQAFSMAFRALSMEWEDIHDCDPQRGNKLLKLKKGWLLKLSSGSQGDF